MSTEHPELLELYRSASAYIATTVRCLRRHQCDESGVRNPDRYDNEGTELKRKLEVLKEIRDKLETIL